jgi:hypothetical protein
MSDKTNIVRLGTKKPLLDRAPPTASELADLARALGEFEAAALAAHGAGAPRVSSLAALRPASNKGPLSLRKDEPPEGAAEAPVPLAARPPGPKSQS